MAPGEVIDDVDMGFDGPDDDELAAQKRINEEYKMWKKNCPFLYDMILSTALDWPTLTTQWLPDVQESEDKKSVVHRLLIGTHTSENKPNYVQIAEVTIPKAVELRDEDYDDERGEAGGYGNKSSSTNDVPLMNFKITHKIDHPGEVNKARYQPQNPDVIATLAVDGRVLVFNRANYPLEPSGEVRPTLELIGHTREGFGLDWSPHAPGQLVTGSEDCTVLLWDTQKAVESKAAPFRTYKHHTHIVNDVQYHPQHSWCIGTVSDDLTLQVLDLRAPGSHAALVARDGHTDAINALAWNLEHDMLVATASADKTIALWDIRNVKQKIYTLEGHVNAVTSLAWNPHMPSILGSGSYDRRFHIWDFERVGDEQTADDAEDGVPELMFMHGGHTNHLADFSWNPNDPWLVASAAEDNVLEIWKIAHALTQQDGPTTILPTDELGVGSAAD